MNSDLLHASNFSGLVFVGYGDREIYPACQAVEVAELVENSLRYVICQSVKISNNKPSEILPFAQRDVIDTVLNGVDPNLKQAYLQMFNQSIRKYNVEIATALRQAGASQVADLVENADLAMLVRDFNHTISQYENERYSIPTKQTTALLSKEDLAEMAESLIYLTFLKRRFMSQEESVGGPVDVAVISKGEGFIWIKRKFYFDPNLNPHFFKTYFTRK